MYRVAGELSTPHGELETKWLKVVGVVILVFQLHTVN